jgi:hypothetical protein
MEVERAEECHKGCAVSLNSSRQAETHCRTAKFSGLDG